MRADGMEQRELLQQLEAAGFPVDRCGYGLLFGSGFDSECRSRASFVVFYRGCEGGLSALPTCEDHAPVTQDMIAAFGFVGAGALVRGR